jgi:hypothetical protein
VTPSATERKTQKAAQPKSVTQSTPSPAAFSAVRQAAQTNVPTSATIVAEVNSNLDSLKDTLLRIELRRQAGTISDEEYALERGRAEQLLRDLVQG